MLLTLTADELPADDGVVGISAAPFSVERTVAFDVDGPETVTVLCCVVVLRGLGIGFGDAGTGAGRPWSMKSGSYCCDCCWTLARFTGAADVAAGDGTAAVAPIGMFVTAPPKFPTTVVAVVVVVVAAVATHKPDDPIDVVLLLLLVADVAASLYFWIFP